MWKSIKFWLDNARYVSIPQSLLPGILALTMATNEPDFSWWMAILAILGVEFAHLGINLMDDYFDYKNNDGEVREVLADQGMRSRIAKCFYLTSGQTDLKHLRMAISVFIILALICGGVLFYFRGDWIFYLTLITAILGFSYSGKPLQLGYYGLGELIIGIVFGPLLMAGVYYSAAGTFSMNQWMTSIAVGLLVMNIVYSHAVMDAVPDKHIGKMTFAQFFTPGWQLFVSAICNFAPFILIVVLASVGILPIWYLFVLLALPLAIYLFYSLVCFVNMKPISLEPKWWMGPMELWAGIKQAGIDWFMIRWFTARNIISLFCLILIIINAIL